ncbi:unnamed protein product [Rotaria sordida]|uniref:Uncharacterized protein n=1 Tax=Rotaria sordida TaxID=392033 RepID=A0A814E838_9BILA|nr:unnamed protein product [Rotaria sordida]CAF1019979.1 unnamed protein product [Rotaria sordida]CAF3711035.1 unnamed protein product [Rotaria sordida]CAF3913145.1 unnamed protein product [Rotaria sordida]
MSKDIEIQQNTDESSVAETFREDVHAIAVETKDLIIEARLNLTLLIGCILLVSLISVLLSTWIARTITNSPTSLGTIVSYYFGLDHNNTEQYITWWTPIHIKSKELISKNFSIKTFTTTTTIKTVPIKLHYNEYSIFRMIILPFLFMCSIFLAILAYYARVQCTKYNFAWGTVPKISFENGDSIIAKKTIVKMRAIEPNIDYVIVHGAKEEPDRFALADTSQPLHENGDIIDEGTQCEPEDILKVITHDSSTS